MVKKSIPTENGAAPEYKLLRLRLKTAQGLKLLAAKRKITMIKLVAQLLFDAERREEEEAAERRLQYARSWEDVFPHDEKEEQEKQ